MTKSAYEILGIPRNASQQDIETAWRKAAQRLHPDKNPGDARAHERFIQARAAYNQLQSGTTTKHSSPAFFHELMEQYNLATALHSDNDRKKQTLKQQFRNAVRDYRHTHTLVQHLVTRWFPLCQRHKAAVNLHSLHRPWIRLQDLQTALHITHVGAQIMILKNTPAAVRDITSRGYTGLLNTHIKRLRQQTEAIDNALAVLAGRESTVKFTL